MVSIHSRTRYILLFLVVAILMFGQEISAVNSEARGSYIVFTSHVDSDDPLTVVWIRADGTKRGRVGGVENTRISSVDCNYDTQRLAVAPNDEYLSYLYLLDFDGTTLTRAMEVNGAIRDVSFSPDGTQAVYSPRITYYFIEPEYEEHLALADLENKTHRILLREVGIAYRDPRWLADGTQILYSYHPEEGWGEGNHGIGIINIDGSDNRIILDSTNWTGNPDSSPDGQYIVFSMTQNHQTNIYTMRSDGKNIMQLTNRAGNNIRPRWSPDGQFISFSSDRGGQGYRIYTMDAQGKNIRQLTDLNMGNDYNQCWM